MRAFPDTTEQERDRGAAASNWYSGKWLRSVGICAATALAILGFFLSIYSVRGYVEPIGYDTPHYIWRQNCVGRHGLQALDACAPPGARAWPSRVGNPLVALPLSSVLGVSPFTFAAILPPLAAVAIALGGAVLLSSAVPAGTIGFAAVAIIVGTSPMVVRMAGPEGYADMMLATALGLVTLVVGKKVIDEGVGHIPAGMLLALAALTHWPTAALFALALAGLAVLRLPASIERSREGSSFLATTSGRLAVVLAGSVTAWAAALAGLGAWPDPFRGDPGTLARKFRAYLPRYGLPVALPAAVAGEYRVWKVELRPPAVKERFLAPVLGLWLMVVAAAVAAWLLGFKTPVDRFLMLALPVPMLAAVALLWLAETLGPKSPRLRRSVIVSGATAAAAVGYFLWLHVTPVLEAGRLGAAATAARYLEENVRTNRPVRVIAEGPVSEVFEMTEGLWAAFPPERLPAVHVRRGFPEKAASRTQDPRGPVLLLLQNYSERYDDLARTMPRRVVAPGVLVLRGPIPPDRLSSAPAPRLEATGPVLVLLALTALAGLAVVGSGWTVAALGRDLRPLELCSLAPCFGLAFLIAAGLLADLAGVRVAGSSGALVLAATGIAGLGAAWRVLGRRPSWHGPRGSGRAAVRG